jgi:hypothetical protein
MNVRPNLQMDKPAFLAWVEGREGRYELVDGRVVDVTGGSRGHAQITANLFHILHSCLDRHRWTTLPGPVLIGTAGPHCPASVSTPARRPFAIPMLS